MVFGFSGTPSAVLYWLRVLSFVIAGLTDYTPALEIPPRERGDRRRWKGPAST